MGACREIQCKPSAKGDGVWVGGASAPDGAFVRRLRPGLTNVLEPMDLALVEEERRGDGVDGGVAPALVVEAAGLLEVVEVGRVRLGAPEAQVSDLEVGPDWGR